MRNLEDFARLWICGMPTLPSSQSYSVQIGWSQIDSGAPKLRQIAHRLMTQQVGTSRDSDSVASAAVTVYRQLLDSLSPLLGELGSAALLRRSLRLTETAFPCYTEVRRAESDGLLQAVGVCLRRQSPDIASEASVALLATYLELLATLIGEQLTRQLLQEAWPELFMSPSEKRQA